MRGQCSQRESKKDGPNKLERNYSDITIRDGIMAHETQPPETKGNRESVYFLLIQATGQSTAKSVAVQSIVK